MPRFRLNHNCGKKGCEGMPGDVITVSRADADYLQERGGGEIVEDATDDTASDAAPKAKKTSTATDKAAEKAEKR